MSDIFDDRPTPAVVAALKVIKIASELSDADIDDYLKHASKADATFGTLWGAGNPDGSLRGLKFLNFLADIVRSLAKVKLNEQYQTALAANILLDAQVREVN